jgi:predicted nucleic acid-binding protein
MLVDSNILIYALLPEYSLLMDWILDNLPSVSIISKIETLGYHRLTEEHKTELFTLFSCLTIRYPSFHTYEIAIALRQRRKMSLGDALIAATAIEYGTVLVTRNTSDFDWIENLTLLDPLCLP